MTTFSESNNITEATCKAKKNKKKKKTGVAYLETSTTIK